MKTTALITAAAALPDPAKEYEDSWFDVVTDWPDASGLDRPLVNNASPGEDEAAQ